MIIIILLIFFIYCINNNREYFNSDNIFKDKFLEFIDLINSQQENDINYDLNIISSINKKYFELTIENSGFIKLLPNQNTTFKLKKLKDKNAFNLINNNNLVLNYDKKNNIINSKIINLNEDNVFYIENIENTFFEIDYNKFRFTATLRSNNKYLGHQGFSANLEKLYFDVIINI